MLRLIKELKPFTILIFLVIGLLFIQAMTDLALPDYMSNIVDVGIQQNGIENTVAEAIKVEEFEKIKLFIDEEDAAFLDSKYKLIDKENLNEKEYEEFINKYPILESEELYILDTSSKEDIEKMNSFLGKPIFIVSSMEKGALMDIDGKDTNGMEDLFKDIPEGMDPFDLLGNLPKEQLDTMRLQIDEGLENISENMIRQTAINHIKAEYESMGIDTRGIQINYILYIGGIMLLIAFIGMVASIIVGFLSSRIAASFGRNLRDKLFRKVISFSNAEFDNFSTASLITRSSNDIQQIQQFTVMVLRMVFFAPILGVGGVLRALDTNTSMAWVVGVGVGGILILVTALFSIVMPKFKIVQTLIDKVNLVTRESLNGMPVIRAFNAQELEEEKFDMANQDLTKTNLFVSRIMVMMMPSMNLIMNGTILLIVWVGAKQIDQSAIQVGDMMAFMQYAMQIIMSFLMLSMVSIMLPRATVSAQRIAQVLEEDLSIKESETPIELGEDIKGLLEFKDVRFRYPGAEECVLKDISFTAKPGETTAFIGSTGSGKSTLINLIPRFYDVTRGEILLDGVDVRDIRFHELRDKIGYVPQRNTLFTGTIDSNLRYGKNVDAGDEDILNAIEISQAKGFIEDKTDGIESEISQGGTNVSGGQKQRLSIARALAKKPDILIFDDSFSALDFKTDAALRSAMNKDLGDRTVLIVAQRINTIMNAEKIIVLDQGEIVGIGVHKELLKECNVYRQIALSQLSEEELAI